MAIFNSYVGLPTVYLNPKTSPTAASEPDSATAAVVEVFQTHLGMSWRRSGWLRKPPILEDILGRKYWISFWIILIFLDSNYNFPKSIFYAVAQFRPWKWQALVSFRKQLLGPAPRFQLMGPQAARLALASSPGFVSPKWWVLWHHPTRNIPKLYYNIYII